MPLQINATMDYGRAMTLTDHTAAPPRRRALVVAMGAVALLWSGAARAMDYPTKPVRIVLPFAAGGVADITARLVAERLGAKLGGRFYIENQPGAGGIAAARSVIAAPPDGHTLALLSNGTAVSASLFKKLPFDPLKEFAPVSSLGTFDFIFATSAASPFRSIGDLMAAAKDKPGALNIGTISVGSTQNLAAELFRTAAALDVVIIPHRGTPELLVSLLQGDLALTIDSYSALKGNLADGKLRALASSGPVRGQATPDLPTLREAGVADYEVVSWNALFAPAGTPPEVIAVLNAALRDVLAEPALKAKLLELGIEAKASTPEDISARLKADIDKWRGVIDRARLERQ